MIALFLHYCYPQWDGFQNKGTNAYQILPRCLGIHPTYLDISHLLFTSICKEANKNKLEERLYKKLLT